MRQRLGLAVIAAYMVAVPAFADLRLPSIFSDGMVLQRDVPAVIYGTGAAESVSYKLEGTVGGDIRKVGGDVKLKRLGDGNGWQFELPPSPAGGPYTLTISAGADKKEIKDVYFGDVFLCGGQSNMQSPVDYQPDETLKGKIHLFGGVRPGQVPTFNKWTTSGTFSKIGWHVAMAVARDQNVPVGMVYAAQGGTPVRPWIGPTDANPTGGPLYKSWVAPLAGYRVKGAIWWQGENDAHREEADKYDTLFPEVIKSWRKAWGQGDFAFVWVQLQRFGRQGDKGNPNELPEGWALVRDAQRRTLALPNTAMAVAFDVTRGGNHPGPDEKLFVGRRMGNAVLAVACGKDIEWSGPLFDSAKAEGGKITVSFMHGKGLKAAHLTMPKSQYDDHDTTSDVMKLPTPPLEADKELKDFELQSAGGEWKPVAASIENDKLFVSAAGAGPFKLRYAWKHWPEGNLYNGADLPASPFVSDVK